MTQFLSNKYTKWYYNIINNAQLRILVGYVEKHHIIPKSLGGSNRADNLVKLTAREHFICHWLLTKMVIGDAKHKMLTAAYRMMVQHGDHQQRIVPTGRIYESIRTQWAAEHSKWLTGRFSGSNNPNFGKRWNDEARKKMSIDQIGKKASPETKLKMSVMRKGVGLGIPKNNSEGLKKSWEITREDRIGENHPMYGRSHSESSKNKMKDSSAKRWTPEARAAFSAKLKEKNRLKKMQEKP
jgi:hypothetical protein